MKKIFLFFFIIFLLNLNLILGFSASVHVPEKYTKVSAGERFYFILELKYPENPLRKDITFEYEITDKDEIVTSSKIIKSIENQASFMDYIVIPENVESCSCRINVRIKDTEDTLDEEIYTSFNIRGSQTKNTINYLFVLFGIIITIGVLVLVELHRLKNL